MLGWQEGDRGRAQETTQEEKLQVREVRHRRDTATSDIVTIRAANKLSRRVSQYLEKAFPLLKAFNLSEYL